MRFTHCRDYAVTDQTDILRQHIEHVMARYSLPLRAAGLHDVLRHLQAWAAQVDARLDLLSDRLDRLDQQPFGLHPALTAKLQAVIDNGARLEQLGRRILDAERPGGALPGDRPL